MKRSDEMGVRPGPSEVSNSSAPALSVWDIIFKGQKKWQGHGASPAEGCGAGGRDLPSGARPWPGLLRGLAHRAAANHQVLTRGRSLPGTCKSPAHPRRASYFLKGVSITVFSHSYLVRLLCSFFATEVIYTSLVYSAIP